MMSVVRGAFDFLEVPTDSLLADAVQCAPQCGQASVAWSSVCWHARQEFMAWSFYQHLRDERPGLLHPSRPQIFLMGSKILLGKPCFLKVRVGMHPAS